MGQTVIRLGTSGIVGVTNLTTVIVDSDAGGAAANPTIASNSAVAVTGNTANTITLPQAADVQLGDVIKFKNLKSGTSLITINRNSELIDGTTNDITTQL